MFAVLNDLYVGHVFQCYFVLRPMVYVSFPDSKILWVLAHVGVISVSPLPLGHILCVGRTDVCTFSLDYVSWGAMCILQCVCSLFTFRCVKY